MVDLSIIYSKTGKGLRARNAADAGLSTKQLKLLALIDGKSKADEILNQTTTFTEKELAAILSQLESNGFIRPLAATQSNADDWALTANFTPMVVEEFKSEDEIEAEALAKAQAKAAQQKQDAERIAAEKASEKIRWKAEINARKEAEAKHKTKEKANAVAIEKARLAQERIAREAALAQKKADAEAKTKAAEEAQLKAKLQAKAEHEAQLETMRKAKAELKLQQEAQQAAEQARLEIERLDQAKQAQLEAERIAKAENDAALETARKAKLELKLQQELQLEAQQKAEQVRTKKADKEAADAAAKQASQHEMARIVRKAEEERKQLESQAKEARLEAKRHIKAAEQARVKAARKAKDDVAQARVNAAAIEQKKIVLQQAVQIEMDRFTRGAENEKNIAEATEHDAELLQLAEAQHARLQAEQLVDKIAEQQTELQAEEERQAAVEQSKEAEIALQLAAQQAQEKAEKIRANNEAGEQAALAEKELARQEMARIAREADALRSQANNPTLTKPTKSGRFEASRTAKLKQSTIQANKNAKNLAEVKAQEAEKRAYSAITEKQPAAKQQAEIKAPIKTKRRPIDLMAILLNCLKWLAKLFKTTLLVGVLLALLLIGALHFVNISPLIAPIETLAADSLGSPVHIEQVRAALWPQPHLVLGNVTIGDNNSGDALKMTSLQVMPDVSTLFEDVKRLKSLQLQGLVIEQSTVQPSLQLIQQLGKAPALKIEQLNVGDLRFKVRDLVLGPFDGRLVLNTASELTSLDLHSVNNTLLAHIKPQGTGYEIELAGTKWPLPLNPTIVFDELKANASIHQNQMTFSQIEGAMFGGNISAKAVLDWSSGWHITANFMLTNANTPQLLTAFTSKASIDGKVRIRGDFASQSTSALKLMDAPTLSASMVLENGKINGVDLAHAVLFNQNASLMGDATAFDRLSANLQVKDGQYHYKQIALDSKQFHAKGNLDIAQNQLISGRVNAVLTTQSRRLQADFGLTGSLANVKRQ